MSAPTALWAPLKLRAPIKARAPPKHSGAGAKPRRAHSIPAARTGRAAVLHHGLAPSAGSSTRPIWPKDALYRPISTLFNRTRLTYEWGNTHSAPHAIGAMGNLEAATLRWRDARTAARCTRVGGLAPGRMYRGSSRLDRSVE